MSIKAIKRAVATLKMPKKIAQYIAYIKAIVEAMTGNAYFPTPNPSLATVTTDINALDAAESVALNRAKGSAGARDVQKAVVDKDLYGLQAYVQSIADANPANAIAIIESAGMSVRRIGIRQKGDFEVKHGKASGSVILSAKSAGPRASYEWEVSNDNVNWRDLPDTIKSRTTVSGLTPGATFHFRFRSITKNGEGSWSQVVSIVVV